MNMSNTPQIRFAGFTDAWEQRKVWEIADRYDNLRVPVAANLRVKGTTPYYGANGIQDYVDGFTHEGEFILVAEDGANDLKNYPVNYVNGRIWVNNHAHVLQGKENVANNRFLSYAMSQANIESVLVGGGRAKLNADVMMNIELVLPKLEEQQQIGAYFRNLDTLITLHQRKCDTLKALKKAMLQKMFPKEGASVPEIRFAGFTDDWEQRKLGEVIKESYNGQTPSRANDEYWNGDLNWLASGDLNRGIVTHTTEKITNKGLKDTRLRIVPKGTFVMAITGLEAAGTRGNCGILAIDTALNQSCMALFPNDKILDTTFLFQWYRKVGEEYGINYTQGTKQQSYNAELIQILPISFPKIEEQRKIADYFLKLDTLITLHQRKLDTLQKLKKAMLQKMFV